MTRAMPYDRDAEESVLGAMLSSPKAAGRGVELLRAEHFHTPNHRHTFEAIKAIYDSGQVPDPVVVMAELRRRGTTVGGGFLGGLMEAFSTISSLPSYAAIVVRQFVYRRLISLCEEAMELAYEGAEDPEKIIATMENELLAFVTGPDGLRMHRGVSESMEILDDPDPQMTGFTSGLGSLDNLLGGFRPGKYIIVAAPTSEGKTSLLTQLDVRAAKEGRKVAHFSLEMPARDVIHRFLAQESGVQVAHFTNPRLLDDDDWKALSKSAGEMATHDVTVFDRIYDIDQIISNARRMKLQHGLDVVVVDYIQLVEPSEQHRNREGAVSEISRKLKRLAQDFGLTVLCASQFSREQQKEKRRPVPSDLRESGRLEHDSDVLILMWRPPADKDEPTLSTMFKTEIIVAKNRDGARGRDTVWFDAPRNRFEEE